MFTGVNLHFLLPYVQRQKRPAKRSGFGKSWAGKLARVVGREVRGPERLQNPGFRSGTDVPSAILAQEIEALDVPLIFSVDPKGLDSFRKGKNKRLRYRIQIQNVTQHAWEGLRFWIQAEKRPLVLLRLGELAKNAKRTTSVELPYRLLAGEFRLGFFTRDGKLFYEDRFPPIQGDSKD